MKRMDSWGATTAFSLLDLLVPQRGDAREILYKAVPLTAGMRVSVRDEEAFHRLLSQAVENAHEVLVASVLPEEGRGTLFGSVRDDLPTVPNVVASTGYHATWFWLMASRFACYLASGNTERKQCRGSFIEVVEWMHGRAALTGAVRIDILAAIARHTGMNPERPNGLKAEIAA